MRSALPSLAYYRPEFDRLGPGGSRSADLCIYGGTPAGIIAALTAARLGRSVLLLESGPRIGGMTTSGLGFTDIGNKAAIGGLAREFYRRVGKRYGVAEAWTFEPGAAESVFVQWLAEASVPFHTRQFLAGVETEGRRITALRTTGGLHVRARAFIDASYEGDLLAAAGVGHFVGREDNATYGETLNGAQVHDTHQFESDVSPYVIAGDRESGLLPGIETGEVIVGAGDRRIQAYCFRMCLTDDPANRRAFERPRDYDPRHYVLLQRYLAAGWRDVFSKFDRLRVRTKTDTNNHGAVSTDFIGQNHAWPNADYATRERIFQAHVTYQQGLHWYLAHDPSVPAEVRERYAAWGLCRDEFVESGGWPTQLYVREARRMIGDYVMTEHDCRGKRVPSDPIALAAYTMDSHNCRRFVLPNAADSGQDAVRNEGDVQVHGFPPYPISYRAIVPRAEECENLLVPVCLSASHIAYGSIRMEPVFMILGQSAALAAHLALTESVPVQAVPYADLRSALLDAGQVLSWANSGEVTRQALHASEG
ncbi:MAG TPA: FAD-dependent oxidoreductase [Opitutus sp.]|nr:FAD-dependent oxidoreductase [Opitutus sp.]